MKKILYTLIVLAFSLHTQSFGQGVLVEDTVILHLTMEDIDSVLQVNNLPLGLLPQNYEVDVHRVIYETPDVDGAPTVASGLVFLPDQDTCAMPMMAYLHGTKLKKDETFYYLRGEWFLGVLTAMHGYASVLPDYLGLGAGPGIHPYQHNDSQVSASIDIMRACRFICEDEGKPLNDQLFIVGYSQGGHSVMGTHRKIQEDLSDEFTVTASAPGSGPYDLSGVQMEMVASFEPYAVPGYLPYLIQSYQHVYGDLYDSIQEIYVPPYDETLPPLLDGSVGMGEVNAAMPPVPRDIIQPDYADGFFSDTTHPAAVALRANDVYEWVPEAPVMFNYCRSDEEVTYQNTVIASEYMIGAGADDIQVIERDSTIGHFQCAEPSILFSKFWFDTMADFCGNTDVGVTEAGVPSISVYPNPVVSGEVRFGHAEPIHVQVVDVQGRLLLPEERLNVGEPLRLDNIPNGMAFAIIRTDNGTVAKRLLVQR